LEELLAQTLPLEAVVVEVDQEVQDLVQVVLNTQSLTRLDHTTMSSLSILMEKLSTLMPMLFALVEDRLVLILGSPITLLLLSNTLMEIPLIASWFILMVKFLSIMDFNLETQSAQQEAKPVSSTTSKPTL
jgi:hypothetical protein